MKKLAKLFFSFTISIWEILSILPLACLALLSRFSPCKRIDIGIGPEPIINNVYHAQALKLYGYSVETYATELYYITSDFDITFWPHNRLARAFAVKILHVPFIYAIFKFKILYIYFNGGSLFGSLLLWRFEPYFYMLAGIRTVVMPYGSDIQVMDKTQNLYFKHSVFVDYPRHHLRRNIIKAKIKLWTECADHIICGCDWVDFLYHWDTLLVSHFAIDVSRIKLVIDKQEHAKNSQLPQCRNNLFKVFHAPNHKAIKGTNALIEAIEALKKEGYKIELVLAQKKPNIEILESISQSDLVVDQLVIGWYAMFAIEAMAMGKPVICNMRPDLLFLYKSAGLIGLNDPPLIHADVLSITSVLRQCLTGQIDIAHYAAASQSYVEKTHSLEAIGNVFDQINKSVLKF
jgi:hypothetical protein